MDRAQNLDQEILTGEIRAIRERHPEADRALRNWAAWSRDERGIRPRIARSRALEQWTGDVEGYALDEEAEVMRRELPQDQLKPEPPEKEDYDQKSAEILNDRMHGAGGLPEYVAQILRVAYVQRNTLEYQMPRQACCSPDAFRERLEMALTFVSRFV